MQWISVCGSQISCISFAWEFVKNTNSWASHLRCIKSKTEGRGPESPVGNSDVAKISELLLYWC